MWRNAAILAAMALLLVLAWSTPFSLTGGRPARGEELVVARPPSAVEPNAVSAEVRTGGSAEVAEPARSAARTSANAERARAMRPALIVFAPCGSGGPFSFPEVVLWTEEFVVDLRGLGLIEPVHSRQAHVFAGGLQGSAGWRRGKFRIEREVLEAVAAQFPDVDDPRVLLDDVRFAAHVPDRVSQRGKLEFVERDGWLVAEPRLVYEEGRSLGGRLRVLEDGVARDLAFAHLELFTASGHFARARTDGSGHIRGLGDGFDPKAILHGIPYGEVVMTARIYVSPGSVPDYVADIPIADSQLLLLDPALLPEVIVE